MSFTPHSGRVARREFLKTSASATTAVLAAPLTPKWFWASQAGGRRKPMPHVIVLLPGIMGSVLRKDGRDIWALSGAAILSGLRSLGGSFKALALTSDERGEDDLGDGITAHRIISDVHILPGFWKIDGYSAVSRSIKSTFDVEPGKNFFDFPYDWRRDNRVAARQLARAAHRWLKDWRTQSGSKDAKLILIAHSMGGLVCRYFLECLDGWKDCRRLVTFGTPYRGSLNALNFLSNGFSLGPFVLADISELVRSFTSVYQLLPTYPCYDAGQGKLVRVGEVTGVPHIDPVKAAAGLRFYRETLDAAQGHSGEDAYVREGHRTHLVVGTKQQTLQSAKMINGKLVVTDSPPRGASTDGDGTVPRPSATPLELEGKEREAFVAEMHASLQNSAPVWAHVEGLLSEHPWEPYRGDDRRPVTLKIDDAYLADDPVIVRAICDPGAKSSQLTATFVHVGTDTVVARTDLRMLADGAQQGETRLVEGTYRVTVSGSDTTSATDVFVVAAAR